MYFECKLCCFFNERKKEKNAKKIKLDENRETILSALSLDIIFNLQEIKFKIIGTNPKREFVFELKSQRS